jgi:glycosyltransferase involved in cell wall biosynthesis
MFAISAIVPTCNRSLLLERALRSIATQETAAAEVIVVDDSGREAATRSLVERFDLGIEVTVIVNSRGKGASAARNSGSEIAAGELLAFLDDDDEWLPPYLGAASEKFFSADLDVVCTDLICRFDDGIDRPGKAAPDRLLPELFLTRNPGLVGSNLVVRRSLYRAIGGFDESLPTCNDRDLGIRLSMHGKVRYQRLSRRLVRSYQHGEPRLSTPNTDTMRAGIRRFFELHAHRMTPAQRSEFRANVGVFWGLDEQGRPLDAGDRPQRAWFDSLLPLVKARLDNKRGRA